MKEERKSVVGCALLGLISRMLVKYAIMYTVTTRLIAEFGNPIGWIGGWAISWGLYNGIMYVINYFCEEMGLKRRKSIFDFISEILE